MFLWVFLQSDFEYHVNLVRNEESRGPKTWPKGTNCDKYTATMGTQLLAKIHVLDDKIRSINRQQNHPIDHLEECINFIGGSLDCIGKVVDELNDCIDAQGVQIKQLANMVNNLIGKTEKQANEIKVLKDNWEKHCKVINMLTAKVIPLEQCVEDVQRKAFPQVGGTLPNHCLFVDTSSSL
jgi:archaellum component FlaC